MTMTITLSSEELAIFQTNLVKWYDEQIRFVFENISDSRVYDFDMLRSGAIVGKISDLRNRYAREHPKPDWRTLL